MCGVQKSTCCAENEIVRHETNVICIEITKTRLKCHWIENIDFFW